MNKFKGILEGIDIFNEMSSRGANDGQIASAEKKLGIVLPGSYKSFLKKHGCLSIGSTEIKGLCSGHMDFVKETLDLRNLKIKNPLPNSYFVIENLDDEHYVVCNSSGSVFEWTSEGDGQTVKKLGSFGSYLKTKMKKG